MTRPGFYLALEGVEGSGKSTVSRSVAGELERRGHRVQVVREPGGTWLGEEVRRLLLHADEMSAWAEAALFAAQRAQLVAEVVGPALEAGTWVISDRSFYSSLAYQGGARGLGVDRVRRLNQAVLGGIEPELVVVLAVDPAVGLGRQVEADRIGAEGVEFQRAVAETYRELAALEPERVVLVPADEDSDAVAEMVTELVEARWEQ